MNPLTPAAKQKIQFARKTINQLETEALHHQAQIKTHQGQLEQIQNEIERAQRHIWEATHPGKTYPIPNEDTFEPDIAFHIEYEDEPASYPGMTCREAVSA